MVFEFLERRSQKKSFERQLKAKEKLERLESRATRFEEEAKLASGITKEREKIKKAKRKVFEASPAFSAIQTFQTGVKSIKAQVKEKPRGKKIFKKPKKVIFGASPEFVFAMQKPEKKKRKKPIVGPSQKDIFFSGGDSFF